jgi:hypothetical protein
MLSTWQRDVGSTEAWLRLGSQSLPARRGATCQEQELEARLCGSAAAPSEFSRAASRTRMRETWVAV